MDRTGLRLVAALVAVLGVGACSTTRSLLSEMKPVAGLAQRPDLTWAVVHRNRLFVDGHEEQRFERHLSAHIEAYRHWHEDEESIGPFPNILDADLLERPAAGQPRNFGVNYDPGTGSYRCRDQGGPLCESGRADWIADRARVVKLDFGSGRCRWTIGDVTETDACTLQRTFHLDESRFVAVTRLDDGASGSATIHVRDIKILALGDSFSAGEGNPHIQWRYGKHPAVWLDARCHRSLMSGPSLAAAYLARTNPHVSVTLLHYGCSGASIADGLVTPWAQLETAADIRAQYAAFGIEGDEFNRLRVVTVRPQIHDVPLTQIAQAQLDLTVDGSLIQPDFVIVSIGGNDIGFASIVEALAFEKLTAIDLKPDMSPAGAEQVSDWRPYASFDQTSWVQSSRNVPCAGLDRIECMARRVRDRISGPAQHRATLQTQYRALEDALDPLTAGGPNKVFMTHYPTFVMREPNGADPATASPKSAVGCDDQTGDGRPGFVPGIGTWWPGAGMVRHNAEASEAQFSTPLNAAIDGAAARAGWNVVETHVSNGRTHGYCSYHRYYNTLVDSYWNQGRRYATGRPLGNIVILRPDNVFNLPVGSHVIWDAARACFTRFPGDQPCLPAPHAMPVMELRRDAEEGAMHEVMIEEPSIWGTTGPVHPNLLGHCNYASAIVTAFVKKRPDMPYGAGLVEAVAGAGADGLKARAVCNPETWGYHHAIPHDPDWATGGVEPAGPLR